MDPGWKGLNPSKSPASSAPSSPPGGNRGEAESAVDDDSAGSNDDGAIGGDGATKAVTVEWLNIEHGAKPMRPRKTPLPFMFMCWFCWLSLLEDWKEMLYTMYVLLQY